MAEEDRTVDADDATMDELRRFAAEARDPGAAAAEGTVDADDATMDELRRFAAEARQSSADPADGTIDADDETMRELRQFAVEAGQAASTARAADTVTADAAPPSVPTVAPTSTQPPRRPTTPLPDIPVVPSDRHHPPSSSANRTVTRAELDAAASVRPAEDSTKHQAWTPPARTVMPTEPEKHPHHHHPGPWKLIAGGLGAVVVVLLVVVLFGVLGGGEDEPSPDGTTPGSSVPVDEAPAGDGVGRGGG